ncbi:unnamed protein product [Paramecium primaurelia]|uniref:Uncharacterized protein n=1 Tax=Paramecium primaurelia TaxID=5886 RepID=A0A8S1PDN0_PARPR|nr:unnamed protein product [Paramecium primaurelia]
MDYNDGLHKNDDDFQEQYPSVSNSEDYEENYDRGNRMKDQKQKQTETQDSNLEDQIQQDQYDQAKTFFNKNFIEITDNENNCKTNAKKQKYNMLFKFLYPILQEDQKVILVNYLIKKQKDGFITISTKQEVTINEQNINFNFQEVNQELKDLKINFIFLKTFVYDEQMKKEIQKLIEQLSQNNQNSQEKQNTKDNQNQKGNQDLLKKLKDLKLLCDEIIRRKKNKEQKNILNFKKSDFQYFWNVMKDKFIELKQNLDDKKQKREKQKMEKQKCENQNQNQEIQTEIRNKMQEFIEDSIIGTITNKKKKEEEQEKKNLKQLQKLQQQQQQQQQQQKQQQKKTKKIDKQQSQAQSKTPKVKKISRKQKFQIISNNQLNNIQDVPQENNDDDQFVCQDSPNYNLNGFGILLTQQQMSQNIQSQLNDQYRENQNEQIVMVSDQMIEQEEIDMSSLKLSNSKLKYQNQSNGGRKKVKK